ncbi:hypothetical protein HDU88_005174 [Geranomyces variabilis]|nr:hypothetical protein HDU88_005174 [Geranomyces variabilis]
MAQARPPTESWRQKCLTTFSFRRQEEVQPAAELMDTMRDDRMSAFSNVDRYRIWSDLAVCYTVADFGSLADLQDGRSLPPDNNTGTSGIPSNESDWKCFYNELTLLTKSFCHFSSCTPPKTDDSGCWEFGGAGGANCPLLLPALPILDDLTVTDEEIAASLSAFLGLPESLHPYYFIQRTALTDKDAAA